MKTSTMPLLMPATGMIFVFGSNICGIHGAGAALFAAQQRGAVYGQGFGLQGNSFAIPTKNQNIETLDIPHIHLYILLFLRFATENPHLQFEVTRIGCGLAGYDDCQIAPLFKGAPKNCHFYEEWIRWLPARQCDLGISPS